MCMEGTDNMNGTDTNEKTIEAFAGFIAHAERQFYGPESENREGDINGRLQAIEDYIRAKEQQPKGQPDWFMNTDPKLAAEWLASIDVYTNRVLKYVVGGGPSLTLAPCWPWHPRAVAELLASMCHYRMAHQSPIPNHVSDLWGRWLTGPIGRVNKLLDSCYANHKEEHEDTQTKLVFRDWTVDHTELPAYLTWWCTSDREGIPPGLRRKT